MDNNVINITVAEAYEILEQDSNSVLVDVRTPDEWHNTGVPCLESLHKKVILVSWRLNNKLPNHTFMDELLQQIPDDKDIPLLFICAAGIRSYEAATLMKNCGYKYCYSINGGFNKHGNDATYNGWQDENLPYRMYNVS